MKQLPQSLKSITKISSTITPMIKSHPFYILPIWTMHSLTVAITIPNDWNASEKQTAEPKTNNLKKPDKSEKQKGITSAHS